MWKRLPLKCLACPASLPIGLPCPGLGMSVSGGWLGASDEEPRRMGGVHGWPPWTVTRPPHGSGMLSRRRLPVCTLYGLGGAALSSLLLLG